VHINYTYAMKRFTLKQILTDCGYSNDSIKSIMCGRMRPSYEKIIEMHDNHGIPFDAWQDIRTYLQDNDTPIRANKSTTKA